MPEQANSPRAGGDGQARIRCALGYALDSPEAVALCLRECVNGVITGALDYRIAATVATLCGHIIKAMEQDDLAARVAALEAEMFGLVQKDL